MTDHLSDRAEHRPGAALGRRTLLGGLALAALGLAGCAAGPIERASSGPTDTRAPAEAGGSAFSARLADLETRFGGRIGVHAVCTASGASVSHRARERFLMCSTAKAPTVAAVLRRAQNESSLLDRRIRWTPATIAGGNSPVGQAALATGLTVGELCDAAVVVSDNTAQNRLLELLGGPTAMTRFVRELGDPVTRFDRYEPEMTRGAPGDERDTTTPEAMVGILRALALGEALSPFSRERLIAGMVEATTGLAQLRAGVPVGWRVADKTGTGAAGESNDIGVVWPPGRAPIVVAVFTDPTDPENVTGKAAIASSSAAVVEALVI